MYLSVYTYSIYYIIFFNKMAGMINETPGGGGTTGGTTTAGGTPNGNPPPGPAPTVKSKYIYFFVQLLTSANIIYTMHKIHRSSDSKDQTEEKKEEKKEENENRNYGGNYSGNNGGNNGGNYRGHGGNYGGGNGGNNGGNYRGHGGNYGGGNNIDPADCNGPMEYNETGMRKGVWNQMWKRGGINYIGHGSWSWATGTFPGGQHRSNFGGKHNRYAKHPYVARDLVFVVNWWKPGDKIREVKEGRWAPVSGWGEGIFMHVYFCA